MLVSRECVIRRLWIVLLTSSFVIISFIGSVVSDDMPRLLADLELSRLESWSRDVSRPIFTSLGLGLGLELQSLGLGLGLGTLQSRSWSWDLRQWRLGLRHS